MYDYPIAVSLTVAYTGLTGRVGYRLAGTQPQAFSTVHVAETTVSGNYEYADGVRPPGLGPLPDEFAGKIIWGIRDPDTGTVADVAEEIISPRLYEYINRPISAAIGGGSGDGAIVVGDDYGGGDYRVESAGIPVDDAVIRAFLADDYDAGRRTAVHVKGETTTDVAGRWINPLLLDPGDYVLLVARQGAFSPAVVRLTVQPE
jgi:hypothetical protein